MPTNWKPDGAFDFSEPEATQAPGSSFGEFDFSEPEEENKDGFTFSSLTNQLLAVVNNPADSFNYLAGRAAQVGATAGWLVEQSGKGDSPLGGALESLAPGLQALPDAAGAIFEHGAEAIGQQMQKRSRESADFWLDRVGEDFKKKAAAGIDDPEFGVTTLYAAALGSLPEMILTMGSGAVAGKLGALATSVTTARVAAAAAKGSVVATKILQYAKYAPTAAGALAGGATEGAMAAGASGLAMEDRVNAMSHDELVTGSDRYLAIYQSAEGMPEGERRDYARRTTAEEMARTTASWVGMSTAVLGAPTGGLMGYLGGKAAARAGAKAVAGKLESSITGQALAGFASEGAQEFMQEGSQQFLQNLGLREYADKGQSLSEGVLSNAVIGGLVGGVMGGSITPLVGSGARKQAKAKDKAGAASASPEAAGKFSRNPILEAKIVEQLQQVQDAKIPPNEFAKVARWAGQSEAGGRSSLEFSKALEQLIEDGVAPEQVESAIGDDFDDNGMLTEAAYDKDSKRLAFDVEMRIKPLDDQQRAATAEALAKNGANPYVMNDGTMVVPQSQAGEAGLVAVAESIKRAVGVDFTITRKPNEESKDSVAEGAESSVSAAPEGAAVAEGTEGVLSEEEIVNPIPRDATPEQKLEAIRALTAENKPLVDDFIAQVDAELGTTSGSSIKGDEQIIEKSKRPSIIAEKPWHDIEHVRDTFRFKSVIDTPKQLESIADKVKDQGWEIVKVDVEKMATPKSWGWRFVALDMRMPNGQLVEYYMPLKELEAAKKSGGHELFEKWRNRDLSKLLEQDLREFEFDQTQSYEQYNSAYQSALSRAGLSESEALASAKKLADKLSSTGAKASMKSSDEKLTPRDQTPSRREAAQPSSSTDTQDKSLLADTRISEPSEADNVTVAQPGKHVTVTPEAGPAGIEAMGRGAAVHPESPHEAPSTRELVAGNYPKGHGTLKGQTARENISVSIENVPGSIRRAVDGGWSRKMKHWYGYIRGTKDVGDGKLDVYIGRSAYDNTLPVFVIRQMETNGAFDEPKVMLGYASEGEAKNAYLSEYPAALGSRLFGGITRMTRAQFASYLETGDTDVPPHPVSKKPMVELRGDISLSLRKVAKMHDPSQSGTSFKNTVLYHGTSRNIVGDFERSKIGAMGPAVYLSPYKDVAGPYGKNLIAVSVSGKYLSNMQWTDYINKYGWEGAEAKAINDGWAGVFDEKFEDAVAVWNPKDITKISTKGKRVIEAGARETPDTTSALLRNLTPKEQVKVTKATATKIVSILENMPDPDEVAAVAFAGRAKRGWYRQSAEAISEVFGMDAPRFAGLLAAMSPQTSVQSNLRNALNTWVNWDAAGRPQSKAEITQIMAGSVEGGGGMFSVLPAWINNTVRALTTENPADIGLSGPKVDSFMRNLVGNVDEVTNDTWMANFAAVDQKIFAGTLLASGDPGKRPGYLAMSSLVRSAARRLTELTGDNWSPAEVQETVWSWSKTVFEMADSAGEIRNAESIVMDRDVTDELLQSTPDFGTLFTHGEYASILEEHGYGEQIERIRARRPVAGKAVAEAGSKEEAGPFARDTQVELERKTAKRLDALRQKRNQRVSEEVPFSLRRPVAMDDFAVAPAKAFKKPGWAILTATREAAGDATNDVNVAANEKLAGELMKLGVEFRRVSGSYQGVDQGANFLILADEATAKALGARYGQESVLTNRGLVYMDGRVTPAMHANDIIGDAARNEDFFSELNGEAFSLGLDFDATSSEAAPMENIDVDIAEGENLIEVSRIVDDIAKNIKGRPGYETVASEKDLPAHALRQINSMGANGLVEGFFDPSTQKVFVIANNVSQREGESLDAAVERIFAEETLGHYGLYSTLGKGAMDKLLDQVWRDFKNDPAMRSIVDDYANAYGNPHYDQSSARKMAYEFAAKTDPSVSPSLWQKMMAWLREGLRRIGYVREWSDGDLQFLMSRVFDSVRSGTVSSSLEKLGASLVQVEENITESVGPDRSIVYGQDGTRQITADNYSAVIYDGGVGSAPAAGIISFSGDLRSLASYLANEGKKRVVAIEGSLSDDQLAGFEHYNEDGATIIDISEMAAEETPAFSLRNRQRGSEDIEAILEKTIQSHTSELSFGHRMAQWFREMTGYFGSADTWLELKTGWVDSAAIIEKLERSKFGGMLLDAAESAYKFVSLTKNQPQVMAAISKHGIPVYQDGSFVRVPGRKGLYEIFMPLFKSESGKNLLHLWEGYAVARRSSQLINETNPDGTSKEKLLAPDEIDKLIRLEDEYPEFAKVFDDWQEFRSQALDLAVERGALDRETAELWKKNDYVPFFRVEEDEDVAGGISRKRGFSGQKVTSKRLTGSDRRIQPVLENIVMNTASIIDKVYKNEAMNRIVALADGVAMTQEKLRTEAVKIGNEQIKAALEKAGLSVGTLTPEQEEQWTTFFRRVRPEGHDVVSVMVAGKPVYYRVHDPLLLRAIMDMSPVNFGALVDFMGGAKRLLTSMVTLDPAFMARNWMRDTLSSWAVVNESFRPFRDAPKGAAEVWMESGLAVDLAMTGGMTGGFYNPTQDFGDVMKSVAGASVLDNPGKLVDAYKKIGMVSEQVNRMAIAKAVLRRGGSMAEAAYQAQDVLNFSQTGDAVAAQLLIRTVPFLNARIQGLYRLWKGAKGLDGRDPKKAMMAFFMKGLFLFGVSMALALKNRGDERYEKLPDYQKDTYWHIFVGDKHYSIPKPFEVGVMFATLPERAMRLAAGNDKGRTTVISIQRALMDTFAFNPTPQLFKPIVEQWANRSFFTNRPIVGQELEGLEPVAQYNPWTSETARAGASIIDQVVPDSMRRFVPETLRSPVRMEHAMRAYLGTIGGYLMQASDAALRVSGAFPEAPAIGSVRDIPVLGSVAGSFVRGDPELEPSSKYADDLYAALDDADAAYRTMNAYVNQGNLEAAQRLTGKRMDALTVRPVLHDFQQAASEINTMQRRIMSSDMTPEEKRAAMDELTRTKNALMKQAVPYLALMNY